MPSLIGTGSDHRLGWVQHCCCLTIDFASECFSGQMLVDLQLLELSGWCSDFGWTDLGAEKSWRCHSSHLQMMSLFLASTTRLLYEDQHVRPEARRCCCCCLHSPIRLALATCVDSTRDSCTPAQEGVVRHRNQCPLLPYR